MAYSHRRTLEEEEKLFLLREMREARIELGAGCVLHVVACVVVVSYGFGFGYLLGLPGHGLLHGPARSDWNTHTSVAPGTQGRHVVHTDIRCSLHLDIITCS
jgi:hypothetical protein